MKDYPAATMYRCPVQGIVFFADGCGERRFKTAKEAQEAYEQFVRQRERSQAAQAQQAPDRIECRDSVVKVFTGNSITRTLPSKSRRETRQLVGMLQDHYPNHTIVWP